MSIEDIFDRIFDPDTGLARYLRRTVVAVEEAIPLLRQRNELLEAHNRETGRHLRLERRARKRHAEEVLKVQRQAAEDLSKTTSEAVDVAVQNGQVEALDEALLRMQSAEDAERAVTLVKSLRNYIADGKPRREA